MWLYSEPQSPWMLFEGHQQVAAKTLSFLQNKKQIFSSACIISAFILISLSSSFPSCFTLMGLNPAGSLPVFFGARRRCRFWHLRSCRLFRRRLNRELHENGWRWQCQLVRDALWTPANNHRSLSSSVHRIVLFCTGFPSKRRAQLDKTVTSGHRRRKCLGGKYWSRISPQMFYSVGCEIHFVRFENFVVWITW